MTEKMIRVTHHISGSTDVRCLHCFATRLLGYLEKIPVDHYELIKFVLDTEKDYIKCKDHSDFQEHWRIFSQIKTIVETESDYEELEKKLFNLEFVANIKNRTGEFF